jgi:ABC-type lipoprotein release transport system permease subunit
MMGLVLLVTLALLLANLLAAVPAWGAARTKPAPALRGQ